MEKQFIYLINNKAFSSDYEMPKHINFYLGKDQSFTKPYDDAYNNWKSSLTELACDKDQIFKIRQSIYYSNKEHQGYKFEDFIKNPIDITSITKFLIDIEDGKTIRKCFFKENTTTEIKNVLLHDIQVLSGEIVRVCLDTPKLFDACSLVEYKIQEYYTQKSKLNSDEIEGLKKHIEDYKELSTLKELRIVELEESNNKLKLELQDSDKQLSEKQKHIDYAEKVSYQTSCDNAKLIGTVTELKENFNKIEYEHSNQSDLIKKNTNYIKTLESELSTADKDNSILQSRVNGLEKANEDLKREPIGSRMCLTLMHNTMGLTTKISEGVDYIMQNTKEKQIEGSDFNYNLFYKINQMNNMLKKSLDEFYTKYNNPKQ